LGNAALHLIQWDVFEKGSIVELELSEDDSLGVESLQSAGGGVITDPNLIVDENRLSSTSEGEADRLCPIIKKQKDISGLQEYTQVFQTQTPSRETHQSTPTLNPSSSATSPLLPFVTNLL
jgi:hypothetical protein